MSVLIERVAQHFHAGLLPGEQPASKPDGQGSTPYARAEGDVADTEKRRSHKPDDAGSTPAVATVDIDHAGLDFICCNIALSG